MALTDLPGVLLHRDNATPFDPKWTAFICRTENVRTVGRLVILTGAFYLHATRMQNGCSFLCWGYRWLVRQGGTVVPVCVAYRCLSMRSTAKGPPSLLAVPGDRRAVELGQPPVPALLRAPDHDVGRAGSIFRRPRGVRPEHAGMYSQTAVCAQYNSSLTSLEADVDTVRTRFLSLLTRRHDYGDMAIS